MEKQGGGVQEGECSMSTCRCEMKEGVDLRAGYGGVAEDASCQVECGRMPNAMAACAALKAFCPIQAMLTLP